MFRVRSIALSLSVLLLFVVTACSAANDSDSSPSPSASPSASPSSAASASDESAPKKIAAVNYVGDLLALGVQPALTTEYNLDTFGDALQGTQSLGDRPIDSETVLSAAPDLIITDDTGDAAENEQLEKIAPTVTLPFWTTDPYEHLRALGEALGKQAEAEQWIQAYEAKAADTKAKLGGVVQEGDTALLLIISGQDMGISGVRNGGFTLYRQLGFQAPEGMKPLLEKDENFGWETVTMESLTELAPDHLFVEMDDTGAATQDTFDKLMASDTWKSLNAVKNNHLYVVTNKWGLGDASSLSTQLDEALAKLAP